MVRICLGPIPFFFANSCRLDSTREKHEAIYEVINGVNLTCIVCRIAVGYIHLVLTPGGIRGQNVLYKTLCSLGQTSQQLAVRHTWQEYALFSEHIFSCFMILP